MVEEFFWIFTIGWILVGAFQYFEGIYRMAFDHTAIKKGFGLYHWQTLCTLVVGYILVMAIYALLVGIVTILGVLLGADLNA